MPRRSRVRPERVRTTPAAVEREQPKQSRGVRCWPRSLLWPVAVVGLYGLLWPVMEVEYLAHRFPAPFLMAAAYAGRHMRMVGGPAEYLANLFSQTYWRHWLGVLAFTLLALVAWAVARGVLRRFSCSWSGWVAAAFPLLVLILGGNYISVHHLFPMVGGLAVAWLYLALLERVGSSRASPVLRALLLVGSAGVYYLLASGFLYVCVICALFEVLRSRRVWWGLIWLGWAAAAPFGVSYLFLYEPDSTARYLRWIRLPEYDLPTNILLIVMYLFVPLAAAAAGLTTKLRAGRGFGPRARLAVRLAGGAVLALLGWRLVAARLDRPGWLYADFLLSSGRTEEALKVLRKSQEATDPARFLTCYALARTGRLLGEMFHYPQVASSDALLMRDPEWDRFPVVGRWRCDLYMELGRVGESQRWIHEVLTVEGETPRVLERMALVYILNGNPEGASTFLHALERVPFYGPRAHRYLSALEKDPEMKSDELVARVRPLMLRRDYIGTWTTEQVLQQCLEANPSNKLAFDYLIAHYLLSSDMEGLAREARRLKEFYHELPTHVQEALVGYRNLKDSLPEGIEPADINRHIEVRFQNFLYVWSKVQNGPPQDAWEILAPAFGDTYWFFFTFGRTATAPPAEMKGFTAEERPRPSGEYQ